MKEKRKVTLMVAGNDAESPTLYRKSHTGRNEPCPCGSGKKYKNCCGTKGTVYGYVKLKYKVTRESEMKKSWPFPFEIGETVLASEVFPVESFRGNELVIVERGMEEHIGSFYFKVEPVSDPDHLVDTSLWYADGHLRKKQ